MGGIDLDGPIYRPRSDMSDKMLDVMRLSVACDRVFRENIQDRDAYQFTFLWDVGDGGSFFIRSDVSVTAAAESTEEAIRGFVVADVLRTIEQNTDVPRWVKDRVEANAGAINRPATTKSQRDGLLSQLEFTLSFIRTEKRDKLDAMMPVDTEGDTYAFDLTTKEMLSLACVWVVTTDNVQLPLTKLSNDMFGLCASSEEYVETQEAMPDYMCVAIGDTTRTITITDRMSMSKTTRFSFLGDLEKIYRQ